MGELYIGLISGTSADAIDAVLVDFAFNPPRVINSLNLNLPDSIKSEIQDLNSPGNNEIERMAKLDVELGRLFARAVNQLVRDSKLAGSDIVAIGSHGQTIRHIPDRDTPTSYQIGDPNIIVEETGICTVADFRRRDMAAGGQGAPLVPAFHNTVFRTNKKNRVILNIGGIANITILPADKSSPVLGFDTGPGNALLDAWYRQHHADYFDKGGQWASTGKPQQKLLRKFMQDAFFSLPPPKSTGKEYFNLAWLQNGLGEFSSVSAPDIQATLVALSINTIAAVIQDHAAETEEVIVCGGGVHNHYLMEELAKKLALDNISVAGLDGLDPDLVEAIAFAWLAKQTLANKTGNMKEVTGARRDTVLGAIYPA